MPGISVTKSNVPLNKSNQNTIGMKPYTGTVSLTAGAVTSKTTSILTSKTIYTIEYIDASGNVITGEVGTPGITSSGGYYVISVYSTATYTSANLRVTYK